MTNQVDQLYVVNDQHPIVVKTSKGKNHYFTYTGVKGAERSDLIHEDQVMELKLTEAQKTPLKSVKVSLNTINDGAPILGGDYQVKILISQFQDIAEDSMYYKYGFVHVTSATAEAPAFYKAMLKSLIANFSREITKFFKFGLIAGETVTYYDTVKAVDAAGDDATGIVITEVAQDWNRGLMPKTGVNFTVTTDEIYHDGVAERWGDVAMLPATETDVITNGYDIADMEYFYHGERGDQYREFAAPQDRIPTKYLVDPEKEYDVINLHYYFVDSLGGAQKSEKDITIVVPTDATVKAATVAKSLAQALKLSSYKKIAAGGVLSVVDVPAAE